MNKIIINALPALITFAVLFIGLQILTALNVVQAENTMTVDRSIDQFKRMRTWETITASTTDATSTPLAAYGARKVTAYFTRNGDTGSLATSTFNIQVSNNGTTWVNFNKLISNVTNSNSQTLTRVASVQIVGATSTSMVAMDLEYDTFDKIRCVAVNANAALEATDSNTCRISVEN